jgi:hypothetical protein
MKKFPPKRRVLIVGEGRETEYNYMVGFRNAFTEELDAMAISVSVARGKGGDARGIVERAIHEANKFDPNRRLGDRVFLLLDTEGVGRAPELPAAEKLAKEHEIEIVYSSPAFEYWLLCHFEKISRRYFKDCDAVVVELNKKWNTVCTTQYEKADNDVFDRLSNRLNLACDQALKIDLYHQRLHGATLRENPSTQVYELIAILIGARSDKKCPITGTWKLLRDARVTVELEKGVNMPRYGDTSAHWRL